jgi:hypothetical protein
MRSPNRIDYNKLYSNFNYIWVRSFILNGAPFAYKTTNSRGAVITTEV